MAGWVHHYNEAGIEGLKSRKSPSRAPHLTTSQMTELRELVSKGPESAGIGVPGAISSVSSISMTNVTLAARQLPRLGAVMREIPPRPLMQLAQQITQMHADDVLVPSVDRSSAHDRPAVDDW